MKSLLNPVVVALSLGLLACNKTESLADEVKKVYGGPFQALAAGDNKDCKSQVEIAEKLFELEKTERARVRTAIEGIKQEGGFQGAVLERVKGLHDSPLAKSYAAACPVEARAIGDLARKTATAIGLEEVIPPWPEAGGAVLLAAPRSCVLPSGVCFEFRGRDYGGERANGRCDAMSGRMVEQACPQNPRASRCQIEMGSELEHEIFDPEPRPDVAQARCEKPIDGKVYGKWIPAAEAANLPPSSSAAPAVPGPAAAATLRSTAVAPAAPKPGPRAPRPNPREEAF
jgi:hypothetical protein